MLIDVRIHLMEALSQNETKLEETRIGD